MRVRRALHTGRWRWLPLAAALLPLAGAVDAHAVHPAGDGEMPVFSEARHGGQPSHLEAAGSAVARPCPVCLAASKQKGLAPRAVAAAGRAPTRGSAPEGRPQAPLGSPPPPANPRAPPGG